MVTIKNGLQVPAADIYEAFQKGFSDYCIQIQMSLEDFKNRFLGTEGNVLEYSYVAYDGEDPIGVVLGGIREFDNLKTIRCGSLCIAPEYRGLGLSKQLMELHFNTAKHNNCKQLMLEVLKSNTKAFELYKTLGYAPLHDLRYYSLNAEERFGSAKEQFADEAIEIIGISAEELAGYQSLLEDIHRNWQNMFHCFELSQSHLFLKAMVKDQFCGFAAVSPGGKLEQIYVLKDHRCQKIGTQLVYAAVKQLKLNKVSACTPNNACYEGFLSKLGFVKEEVEQFEMYRPVTIQ